MRGRGGDEVYRRERVPNSEEAIGEGSLSAEKTQNGGLFCRKEREGLRIRKRRHRREKAVGAVGSEE